MSMHLTKAAVGSVVCAMAMAGIATAANVGVGVDISTPNVNVRVGTPAPPPRVTVVEKERVIVRETGKHDRGKHKGHVKKHKGLGKY